MFNVFNRTTATDTFINGMPSFKTLQGLLADGKWTQPFSDVSYMSSMIEPTLVSHLIPLALWQNDKVWPIIV